MAKSIPNSELDEVEAIIGRHADGVAYAMIAAALPGIAGFNLKRRLKKLVADKRVHRRGARKGTRYFPVLRTETPTAESISLSPEATAARQIVRKPLTERKPVGYDRSFLDAYRPNVTWYLPAEVRQHLRQIGDAPAQAGPAGTYARRIMERLLIDLAWNSSRLEGNTYTLLDTQKLIAHGRTATGKAARDAQMILNHKQAIEFLIDSAETIDFDRLTLLNLHALLSQNLLENSAAEGRLRMVEVGIERSTFLPLSIPQLVEECFQQVCDTAKAIGDPMEQSFFVLVHIPYLQPFEDVNKRVSRLAANITFVKQNLVPISFVDLPQDVYVDGLLALYENKHIELLRDAFVWAYERSAARYAAVRQTLGDPDPFRLGYREEIFAAVSETVTEAEDVDDANRRIVAYSAQNIPLEERAKFVEVVETELLNLHEGNIARYRLRPSQFAEWQRKKAT
jgi:Fic/DOC family